MSRFHSYLQSATTILTQYKGEQPLGIYLKNFFSVEKKYGSRDRKIISSLCYNYFRTGFAVAKNDIEKKLITSFYVCSDVPNELLQMLKPDWNENTGMSLVDKLRFANVDTEMIFPFNTDLSAGINVKAFNTSFLIQPKLFIRVRPGKQETVRQKLLDLQVSFEEVTETCFSFANSTKLENVIDINNEAVIQDFNSQRVGEMMTLMKLTKNAAVWDCCAASGGKSLLAYDLLPAISLTVSDKRRSILKNLDKRFEQAGLKNYESFVADLTDKKNLKQVIKDKRFDVVICDAPCTGSGTWSRTPEQLLYCKHSEINKYSNLQKAIAVNAIEHVKKQGYFLYITCSAFKKENEEVVEYIQKQTNLTLIKMELLKGYHLQADTMFAALFQATV